MKSRKRQSFPKRFFDKLSSDEIEELLKKGRAEGMWKRDKMRLEQALRTKKKEEARKVAASDQSDGTRCTQCGNESSRLTTQSAKNIGGVMVQLLRPGERLCPCCASLRGHENLGEIHSRMMMEVSNG